MKLTTLSKLFLGLIVSVFLITGCGTASPSLKNYTFKDSPDVNKYKASIKSQTELILKDPQSAKYRFGTPFKGYTVKHSNHSEVSWTGWVIPYEVNAKNGYGGYAGFQPYRAGTYPNNNALVDKRMFSTGRWYDVFHAFTK